MRRKITNLFNKTLDYTNIFSSNVSNISNWNYLFNFNLNWHNNYNFCEFRDLKFNYTDRYNSPDIQQSTNNLYISIEDNKVSSVSRRSDESYNASIGETPVINTNSDFADLVTKSTIYVDKTLFIKEILNSPSMVLFITRPRGWGKTTNLDMLRRFLDINHKDKDLNKHIFTSNEIKKLPDGTRGSLDIAKVNNPVLDSGIFLPKKNIPLELIQGQYPVIYVDFRDCIGKNIEQIEKQIAKNINSTIRNFSYLQESDKSYKGVSFREKYDNLLRKNTDHYSSTTSIQELSNILYNYHGKKVWILINSYDVAIINAYINLNEKEAKYILDFFEYTFDSALKGNSALEKGVVTAELYINTDFNNLSKYDMFSSDYSDYYGLNQVEIEYLLAGFGIELSSSKAMEIKNWYNGYRDIKIQKDGKVIEYIDKYNINSIVNYLNKQNEGYKSHWQNDNLDDLIIHKDILKYLPVINIIEDLVNNIPICLPIDNLGFGIYELRNLGSIVNNEIVEIRNDNIQLLFSYL